MLAAAFVAAFLPLGGQEQASAARLDPEFGQGGVLRVPPDVAEGQVALQRLPDGRILRIEDRRMVALHPSGEVDTGFGERGAVSLRLPPNGDAAIGAVLVDHLGRLLVVTTCWVPKDLEQGRFRVEDRPTQVLAERFSSNGQPDLSFGGGDGITLTDFGLPPAEPGLLPTVLARGGAALDAQGRILVSGLRTAGQRELKGVIHLRDYEAFLGRLGPDGEVDQSFGNNGALAMPGFNSPGRVVADHEDGAFVAYQRGVNLFVARLTPGGQLDPGFGEGGLRSFPEGSNPFGPVGVDPSGALVVSAKAQGDLERHFQSGVELKRMLPNGKLDGSFGRNGVARFRYPRFVYSTEGLDDRGRIVVAMQIRGRNRSGILGDAPTVGVTLARLRADGTIDRSFGRRGTFKLPIPGKGEVRLEGFDVFGDKAQVRVRRMNEGNRNFRASLIQIELGR